MIIDDLFPDKGHATVISGNVLVSGFKHMGAEACFDQIIEDSMSDKNPIFIFSTHIISDRVDRLRLQARKNGYKFYEMTTEGCKCDCFNLLTAANSPEHAVELVYSFIYDKSDREEDVNIICRYLRNCIWYLRETKPFFTVVDVLNLDVDTVKKGLESIELPEIYDFEFEHRFLESKEVYRLWGKIDDRAQKLKKNGLLETISGTSDAIDFFNRPVLLLISASIGRTDLSNIFSETINGMLTLFSVICEYRNRVKQAYHIFLDGISELRKLQFENILRVGVTTTSCKVPICVYEQSMSEMIMLFGESIVDYFGSFLVFCNNDGNFWSTFFGTMHSPDITQSYTNKRNPLRLFNEGGVISKRNSRYENSMVHYIEKPIYEPRVFLSLRENSYIFYNVLLHKRQKKQIKW